MKKIALLMLVMVVTMTHVTFAKERPKDSSIIKQKDPSRMYVVDSAMIARDSTILAILKAQVLDTTYVSVSEIIAANLKARHQKRIQLQIKDSLQKVTDATDFENIKKLIGSTQYNRNPNASWSLLYIEPNVWSESVTIDKHSYLNTFLVNDTLHVEVQVTDPKGNVKNYPNLSQTKLLRKRFKSGSKIQWLSKEQTFIIIEKKK